MSKVDSVAAMAGDIVERESRPPPRKQVVNMPLPKAVKFNVRPLTKEKPKPPEKEPENPEDLPPANKDDVLTKTAKRYDFSGKKMTEEKGNEKTYSMGLHNHGDSPDKPGYAVYELALLCRSSNISQRAAAFQTLKNIIFKNPKEVEQDLKMVQIHMVCINAFNSPTSVTIKKIAGEIMIFLATHFKDPFAIDPYPAVPMHSFFTTDFVQYFHDIAQLSMDDERLFDVLALLTVGAEKIDLKFLEKAKLSLPLMHFARAAFIQWGEVVCQKQALEALQPGHDVALMSEAAVVLRFHGIIPVIENLRKLPPLVALILISRVDEPKQYEEFVEEALKLAPNHFALEFLTSCSIHNMITRDQGLAALKDAQFSQPVVVLSEFCGKKLAVPAFPTTEEECWERRGEIVGIVEYILLHKELSLLPGILPCLFSFTNPSADILIQAIFGVKPPPERPIDPEGLFRCIEVCPPDELKFILTISKYFPLHYSGRFFLRKDVNALSPMFDEFLSDIPDPMKPESIVEADIDRFMELFSYDGYANPAFQKYALLCITQGADVEVRHAMWTKLGEVASFITIDFERKDHYEPLESDMDTIQEIVFALAPNEFKLVGALKIGFKILRKLLETFKGDGKGEMIMRNVLQMPQVWIDELTKGIV